MLASLPEFSEFLLWIGAGLLARITTAPLQQADTSRLTPQDPSTLLLAIAGLVSFAIYYAAIGWRKPRPKSDGTTRRPFSDSATSRKRDAA